MGPEVFAVLAGMLGVSLIAGSRLRARRRTPAAPTLMAAAPTGRWGESRLPAADFDDWHEEEAPRTAAVPAAAAAAVAAPPEPPPLEQLDDDALDDVFAGREPGNPDPASRHGGGRFGPPAPAPSPLVPDARSVFGETPASPPRGGAAGFRSAPRRSGLGGLLKSPALRAAAYAVAGIALVALIVNLALGGDSEPAAERATAPAPTAEAPAAVEPVSPSAAEIAGEIIKARTEFDLATDAARAAETRARAAERRAARRRRAAAAERRRRAVAARRRAARQQQTAPAAPVTPQPSQPQPAPPSGGSGSGSGGGGGGGGGSRAPQCELGCIG